MQEKKGLNCALLGFSTDVTNVKRRHPKTSPLFLSYVHAHKHKQHYQQYHIKAVFVSSAIRANKKKEIKIFIPDSGVTKRNSAHPVSHREATRFCWFLAWKIWNNIACAEISIRGCASPDKTLFFLFDTISDSV